MSPKPAYIEKTKRYERLVLRELQRVTGREDLRVEDVIQWSPSLLGMRSLCPDDAEIRYCPDLRCWVMVKKQQETKDVDV